MSYEEVSLCIDQYEGVVINSKVTCDADFLAKAQHLLFIGRLGSGVDIIDLPAAKNYGIEVIRTPDGNADAVAEHAMGLLLSLLNNLLSAHHEVAQGLWNREKHRGREIKGSTIGIIGMGYTGRAFAARLSGWQCRVLGHDKYEKHAFHDLPNVSQVGLDDILAQCDIISLHLPLTPETRHYVDAAFLSKCLPGTVLINTSRGIVVDTYALDAAINSGHIVGAGLDVLENEKPLTWTVAERELYLRLLNRPNVVASPHVAGWTHESLSRIAQLMLDQILDVLNNVKDA